MLFQNEKPLYRQPLFEVDFQYFEGNTWEALLKHREKEPKDANNEREDRSLQKIQRKSICIDQRINEIK